MMKIALVHDHIQEFGGAERVLVALKDIFPDAPVYTAFYNPDGLGIHASKFEGWDIRSSWVQKIPFFNRWYSPLRFMIPWIWESFDFKEFNLVISSSGWFMSKGIITRPETTHICYLHHPPRSFYYYETAVEWQKHLPFKIYGTLINHNLRLWDYISSQRPDFFMVNSEETKRRVQKFYRRDATVIYPPVYIPKKAPIHEVGTYYITTSRLARAKHIDLIIEVINELGLKLKIIGTGRDEEYLKKIAGTSVEFLGSVSDDVMMSMYQGATAFLFASVDEEFGIAPVEAMGYGLPVIAFRSGGVPEIVEDGKNGYLFDELTKDSLKMKIDKMEKLSAKSYKEMSNEARKTSERFSTEEFRNKIKAFVNSHTGKPR